MATPITRFSHAWRSPQPLEAETTVALRTTRIDEEIVFHHATYHMYQQKKLTGINSDTPRLRAPLLLTFCRDRDSTAIMAASTLNESTAVHVVMTIMCTGLKKDDDAHMSNQNFRLLSGRRRRAFILLGAESEKKT